MLAALSKVDFEYEYSQLSANGHSRKRTAPFNSVYSHKRTLSRKGTRTLMKMKIVFSFCLRSLVSGQPMYSN